MSLSQNIRNYLFWSLDFIKGSPIRKFRDEIQFIIENPNAKESVQVKKTYLSELLTHAASTVKYYQNYSDKIILEDYPVVDKNLINKNYKNFKSASFKEKDCVKVSTSGSTGVPFEILQNKRKRRRNVADNLYFSSLSGYKIGHKLLFLRIWPIGFRLKFLSKHHLLNVFPQSVFQLENEDVEELTGKLKRDKSKKSFIGYPSAFEKICRYLDEIDSEEVDYNVQSIITIAESLNDFTRNRLKKHFGKAPLSRYSNGEIGIIAQETNDSDNSFKINIASYIVETLEINSDKPVPMGFPGRIVITDLFNYAMPIIRYDTGDIGVIDENEYGILSLYSIEGRKLDMIYDTKGRLLSSHIASKLYEYHNIKQAQIIQYGAKEYLIKLNSSQLQNDAEIIGEYKKSFGLDADITIKYVDEIPLLDSGKRKEVVNTFHSKQSP